MPKKIQKNLPTGTRDLVFEEVVALRSLENEINALFEKLGFCPVQTPVLEYFDTFNHAKRSIPEENIYKFSDMDGRLVAMRPDNTSPIVRVALSKLREENLPLKLCYSQNVFRNSIAYNAERSEILQNGIEIIGGDYAAEDLCCLFTAVEAISRCGKDHKIEIGHAGFFDALIEGCGLDAAEAAALKSYVAAKNSGGYPFSLSMKNPLAVELAAQLPRLCGGIEVLKKARALAADNRRAAEILDYLENVYNTFREAGLGSSLIFDLGMVQSIDYYTGLVFRGYIGGVGNAVLSGGRYDALLQSFGAALPACGFALNLSAIAETQKVTMKPRPALSFGKGSASLLAARAYLERKE